MSWLFNWTVKCQINLRNLESKYFIYEPVWTILHTWTREIKNCLKKIQWTKCVKFTFFLNLHNHTVFHSKHGLWIQMSSAERNKTKTGSFNKHSKQSLCLLNFYLTDSDSTSPYQCLFNSVISFLVWDDQSKIYP